MGFLDFLLFPVYVFFFYMFFSRQRKKFKDPTLAFYHKYAFWAKILGSFAITIFYSYLSLGDSTTLYYSEGSNLYHHILKDSENFGWIFKSGKEYPVNLIRLESNKGYFASEANFIIIKFVALFSFVSFGRYMIINLFFSMLAFTGIWRLFLFFYQTYPSLHKKLALAILFLPTVVFWSSGALKDPICMGMLGWFTYAMYNLFYKKKSPVTNTAIIIASSLILFTVKSYILFSYMPFFILYLVNINLNQLKNYFFKFALFVFIAGMSMVGFVTMADKLEEEMGMMTLDKLSESVYTQQKNFEGMSDRAESSFSLGVEFDGSLGSLLNIAPAAINATLFRPYLWESKKISTLLSSLESLSLMLFFLFVLFKTRVWYFFTTILKDPMVMFCFFFSILFALFVGATTLNFGTLVRYKIPCMPFFLIALILIYEKRPKKIQPVKAE
jgi:hypothetical protein